VTVRSDRETREIAVQLSDLERRFMIFGGPKSVWLQLLHRWWLS